MAKNLSDAAKFFGALQRDRDGERERDQLAKELRDITFTPLAHCYGYKCTDKQCDHKAREPKYRKVGAFDTENWQADGLHNGTYHERGDFRLGVLYTAAGAVVFKDPTSMGQYLLSRRFEGFYLWAHNLAYDLQNIWGRELPQEGTLIGSQLYFADYELPSPLQSRQRHYVHFRDSTRHYPARLATLALKLGMQKLFAETSDIDGLSDGDCLERCTTDAQIVYLFISQLQETYNEFGTSLRATVGASSLELFRRRYMVYKHVQPDKHRLELLTRAYYGGRCEAFFVGDLPTGRYGMGDVNSMYPTVMRDLELPIPSREYCWHTDKAKGNFDRVGATDCTVTVPESMYPPLPYKHPNTGKLLFPWGKFRGWWPNNELEYAIAQGCTVNRVHESIWFSARCRPFEGFVNDLYALKLQGGWKALVAKHLLNNCYGKFGQSRPPAQLIPGAKYLEYRIKNKVDSEVCTENRDKEGNIISVLIRPEGYEFPVHANVIWSAYITAAARIRLHSLLVQHNGYYCDTDSVLTSDTLPVSSELGVLALQTSCTGGTLAGPKAYALFDGGEVLKLKVKGIPNRPGWVQANDGRIYDTTDLQAMALMGYRIYFDSPLKLVEGFRKTHVPKMEKDIHGNLYLADAELEAKPNIWYTHHRQLNFACEKRILDGKSGWTRPLKVVEKCQ